MGSSSHFTYFALPILTLATHQKPILSTDQISAG